MSRFAPDDLGFKDDGPGRHLIFFVRQDLHAAYARILVKSGAPSAGGGEVGPTMGRSETERDGVEVRPTVLAAEGRFLGFGAKAVVVDEEDTPGAPELEGRGGLVIKCVRSGPDADPDAMVGDMGDVKVGSHVKHQGWGCRYCLSVVNERKTEAWDHHQHSITWPPAPRTRGPRLTL